tara:strand:- start:888 stop:1709 length:822 start_codon:yes stop_codon:yes gene_type:complete
MKNKLTNHIKTKIGKFQVIHSPSRNFIWYKNAKTAGTSMYRGVILNEIDDVLAYKRNPKEFDEWWDKLTDEKINNCFTFTFVRNPFDRALSAFSHIILEEVLQSHYDTGLPHKSGGRGLLNFDQVYMIFSLFINRILQTYDINKKSVHWMPQHFFVECEGESIVDFVGRYEDLKIDWKYVANKLQISEELPFWPSSNTQKEVEGKGHGHIHGLGYSFGDPVTREQLQKLHWSRYYIDDKLINIVLEVYRKDIDIFGYDYVERQLRPFLSNINK